MTASNGFIEYSTNLPRDIETQVPEISIPYGFESVWHKAKKYYSLERIKILKEKRTRETLIALRDMNLISIEDMCDVLAHDAYMQTNYGAVIKNELGERVTITRGRYNLKPGARAAYIQKRLRNDLKPFGRVTMVSLSIWQDYVRLVMPDNTNLLPVEYAIIHCWKWLNIFLKRLRKYVEKENHKWGYIGTVLEFQDGDDNNGFPHFHVLFSNPWLGSISEIAKLWDWSPAQGVDFVDKRKWERKHPGRKYTALRVANYLSSYLGSARFYDKEKGVHKCHAIANFYGVRIFNLAHEYRAEKKEKKSGHNWKYETMKAI